MGEEKFRVHNVGSLESREYLKIFKGNKKNMNYINQVILTYHPETLDKNFSWNKNFSKIIKALDNFNLNVIITSPGHEKAVKNRLILLKQIKNKKNFSFPFF